MKEVPEQAASPQDRLPPTVPCPHPILCPTVEGEPISVWWERAVLLSHTSTHPAQRLQHLGPSEQP